MPIPKYPNIFSKQVLIFSSLALFIAIGFVLLEYPLSRRTADIQVSAKSPDAIAIRVIPNIDYYSPSRWYKEQGFSGSPQAIMIDGYEAVRDGRSVYANAANIDASGNLAANIYVISYNQDAEKATQDIFNQILAYWKFNTNLTTADFCQTATTTVCLIDPDCPTGDYCQSPKARVTRDIRRLADVGDINSAIGDYRNANNSYPRIQAGSYITNNSLSVWPSWQDTLAKELNTTLPVDPVNQLGSCPGYDSITCWDEINEQFDTALPILPANSLVYRYTSPNSYSYELCAVQESTYTMGSFCFSDYLNNSSPQFGTFSLPAGFSGNPYDSAFITASDPDGDPITWSWSTVGSWPNWVAAPILQDPTPMVYNTKEVYSLGAGDEGVYQISVSINDGRGLGNSTTTQIFNITITNDPPVIATPITTQTVVIGGSLGFTIFASDPSSHYPLTFSTTPDVIADFNSYSGSSLAGTVINQKDYDIAGTAVNTTGIHTYQLTAYDSYNKASAPADFNIIVTNQGPNITSGLMPDGIACVTYPTAAAPDFQIIASDPDGHSITNYSMSGITGLSINSTTGLITGTPTTIGNYSPVVIVEDQYVSLSTDPNYPGATTTTYSVNITDEAFTVSVTPSSDTIYVAPVGVPTVSLYESPWTYSGNANSTMDQPPAAPYSFGGTPPGWLAIDTASGAIQGTPTDNTNDPGTYNVNVIATNSCGISSSTALTIDVLMNYWCGDNVLNSFTTNYGEQCDPPGAGGGTSSNDQWLCDSACQWTGGWCGDGTTQTAYGEECESPGGGTSSSDQYGCTGSCQWTDGWCGDTIIQSTYGEACDTTNLNSEDCNSVDPAMAAGAVNAGNLSCASNCGSFDTSACIPYCVFGGSTIGCIIP